MAEFPESLEHYSLGKPLINNYRNKPLRSSKPSGLPVRRRAFPRYFAHIDALPIWRTRTSTNGGSWVYSDPYTIPGGTYAIPPLGVFPYEGDWANQWYTADSTPPAYRAPILIQQWNGDMWYCGISQDIARDSANDKANINTFLFWEWTGTTEEPVHIREVVITPTGESRTTYTIDLVYKATANWTPDKPLPRMDGSTVWTRTEIPRYDYDQQTGLITSWDVYTMHSGLEVSPQIPWTGLHRLPQSFGWAEWRGYPSVASINGFLRATPRVSVFAQ